MIQIPLWKESVSSSTNVNKANKNLSLSLNTNKTTAYDIRNPRPSLAQEQKGGSVKLVNVW
jgi:hypothetical protein